MAIVNMLCVEIHEELELSDNNTNQTACKLIN